MTGEGGFLNEAVLIERVVESISRLDGHALSDLIRKAIDEGHDLTAVLNSGLTVGLRNLGQGFERGEVFIPELMMGARIVQESLEVLEPHLGTDSLDTKGTFLIGTVAGDLHDVGKNIVSSVFSASGYQVVDLGIDVSAETFVQEIRRVRPGLLGLSALLTTTMANQHTVVEALVEAGLRQTVKIIIGGAPTSASWAESIGADAYAEDVFSGLAQAERLLN
jgi:5-methyltetrahydrofolate--homocysteine methyltransferase